MLPVCLGGVFFASWSKVRKDEYWIHFPARTSSGVFSTCHGGWFWSGTRACLVRPLRSFRGRSIWCFRGGAFSSCSGGLLMSGANMSVVRCAVVKGFATGCTSKRTLRGSLVVHFQVTIEMWFLAGWTVSRSGCIHTVCHQYGCVSVFGDGYSEWRSCHRCHNDIP